LLVKSYSIYNGSAKDILPYFENISSDYLCPKNSNPLDHIFYTIKEKNDNKRTLDKGGEDITRTLALNYEEQLEPLVRNEINQMAKTNFKNDFKIKTFPSLKNQCIALLIRTYYATLKNPHYTLIRVLQVIFNVFLILSLFWQMGEDKTLAENSYNRQGC